MTKTYNMRVKFEVPDDHEDGTNWDLYTAEVTATVILEPENDWYIVDDIRLHSLFRYDEHLDVKYYDDLPKEIQKRLLFAVEDKI